MVLRHPEVLGTCAACGHLVMGDGRALAFDDGAGIIEHSITLIERRRGVPQESCP